MSDRKHRVDVVRTGGWGLLELGQEIWDSSGEWAEEEGRREAGRELEELRWWLEAAVVFRGDDWTWAALARNGRPSKPGLKKMLAESGDEGLMRWRQLVEHRVAEIMAGGFGKVAWDREDLRRFREAMDRWTEEILARKRRRMEEGRRKRKAVEVELE